MPTQEYILFPSSFDPPPQRPRRVLVDISTLCEGVVTGYANEEDKKAGRFQFYPISRLSRFTPNLWALATATWAEKEAAEKHCKTMTQRRERHEKTQDRIPTRPAKNIRPSKNTSSRPIAGDQPNLFGLAEDWPA